MPKVVLITSGPRLDPPIPSNRAWEKPALLAASLRAVRRSMWASWSLVMPSHPSHCASSLPLQSDASPAQSFLTFPSAPHSANDSFTAAASGSGSVYVKRLRLPAPASLVCFSTAFSSFPKASEKSCTPSMRSLSVTSFMEIPTSASVAIVSAANSTSSTRLARGRPWSRNASKVAGGIVLTVSGPISSSM